jgi:SAM-dependent methyltransferase
MTGLIVNALEKVRRHGVSGTARRIKAHILPRRSKLQRYAKLFSGHGLEIGGPSDNFRPIGFVSVYAVAKRIDNVNFASQTTWESSIVAGDTFKFHKDKEPGRQFICEAADLSIIPSASYDFLLSSHTLEHTANPIRALKEWMRVLKNGGHFLVALPDKEKCFDHRRPVTTLGHMIDDFEAGKDETDLTHREETIKFHDLSMSPEIPDVAFLEARSSKNFENRCLHHHTFTSGSAVSLFKHVGLSVLETDWQRPHHLLFLMRK